MKVKCPQTWNVLFFGIIKLGFMAKPWNFWNPLRFTERPENGLFFKGLKGLNLCLKPCCGGLRKSRVLGFEGKERSPFVWKTACIFSFQPLFLLSSCSFLAPNAIFLLGKNQRERERSSWEGQWAGTRAKPTEQKKRKLNFIISDSKSKKLL